MEQGNYPNLLLDYSHAEDAGVYKVSDDLAIVQTLDFFPPIVDEAYQFGQIAACNALSDIYAMGACPKTAMSIVCFPDDTLDIAILREIMQGALSILKEAETALVGGHSISDSDIKFGLSVTGFVNPNKIIKNNSPRDKDLIIVTKPIGTGIINTVLKADMASPELVNLAVKYMTQLNRKAADIAQNYDISCGTDVTGFGLLGHLVEMIQDSQLGALIEYKKVAILPEVLDFAKMGLVPAGTYNNKNYRSCYINDIEKLPQEEIDILFDPQTSGGLLYGVKAEQAEAMLKELLEAGIDAYICGEFSKDINKIEVKF
jgi:selenide,water dikinase